MHFLLYLQSIRTPAMDAFFAVATHLGDEVAVIAICCFFLWCVDRRFAIQLGLAFFAGGMLNQLLKLCFLVARPFVQNPDLLPVVTAIAGAGGYSFPSGHTASAVALYGSLFLRYRHPLARVACVAAVVLVAFSRLYLGVHTPLDVGFSLGIGIVVLLLSWAALRRAHGSRRVQRAVLVAALVATFALALLALFRLRQGEPSRMVITGLAAAAAGAGFVLAWWPLRDADFPPRIPTRAQGVAKMAIGLAGCALLLLPNVLWGGWAKIHAYFLVVMWCVALYPKLWDTIYRRRSCENTDVDAFTGG